MRRATITGERVFNAEEGAAILGSQRPLSFSRCGVIVAEGAPGVQCRVEVRLLEGVEGNIAGLRSVSHRA